MSKRNGASSEPNPRYDPAEFIVPSKDAKGHSEKMWFRCQPGHAHQMNLHARSNIFPYKTESDIIRHALERHLHWLDQFEEPINSVMRQTKMMLDVVKEEQFQIEFQSVFDGIQRVVGMHLNNRATGEITRFISYHLDMVRKMPEGYWRDRYEDKLMHEYGHYLEVKGTGLKKKKAVECEK